VVLPPLVAVTRKERRVGRHDVIAADGEQDVAELVPVLLTRHPGTRLLSGGQGGTRYGQLISLGGCRRCGTYSRDSPVSHDPRQTRLGSEVRAAVEGPRGRLESVARGSRGGD